jgi:cholesterol oxidase
MALEHFDAVVVGSGFGGAVTAYRLAEAHLRVCVLERGKAYPPNSFARTPREMRDNFWDPSEGRHGLFQVWGFGGMDSIVSSGLGGGSLIYANVLLRKDPAWFVNQRRDGTLEQWPVSREALDPHYDNVEAMLTPQQYPLDFEPYASTPKTLAYRQAAEGAGLEWSLPPLAVTFANPGQPPTPGEPIVDSSGGALENLHHRSRYTCRLCGECDIGCNYGSKNTLDYTYLSAAERLGAELRTRCEVRRFAPRDGAGYTVTYVYHTPDNEGRPTDTGVLPETTVSTDRLVLAAGTFGTTFLLLKNQRSFPGLSTKLGHGFSANGDILGFVEGAHRLVAGERQPRTLAPSRGPVITSTIRVPDTLEGGDGPGYYIQEGGMPAVFSWMLEMTDARGEANRAVRFASRWLWSRLSGDPQSDLDGELERLLGDATKSSTFLPLLGMGRDTPDGVLSLRKRRRKQYLSLDYSYRTSKEYVNRVRSSMRAVAGQLDASFRDNPLWYLRKLITVHALGGCRMATSVHDGVVCPTGQVFGYPGFHIADGSVMPGPVGPNPSLTIAALADRFADSLVKPVAAP